MYYGVRWRLLATPEEGAELCEFVARNLPPLSPTPEIAGATAVRIIRAFEATTLSVPRRFAQEANKEAAMELVAATAASIAAISDADLAAELSAYAAMGDAVWKAMVPSFVAEEAAARSPPRLEDESEES
jgi:hypothetical protein